MSMPSPANDLATAGKWLEQNPALIEQWLKEHASQELRQRVHQAVLQPPANTNTRRTSITSDLFQLWLAASPANNDKNVKSVYPVKDLDSLEESELFMELIRDVANELDINVLSHKILKNVSILTHADRGSLFLARGPPEDRYLVAKLFDVQHDTSLEEAVKLARSEEIRIPFGVGIAGTVAHTKTFINIKDAYKDPRFSSEMDRKTGYRTNLVLCMPICNYEGDVIGVAQIINKTNESKEFTPHDVEVFKRYLTFCGIGIQNAQLFEISVLEYKRNQILLNLARSIFEEQNNLECLVTKIMREAQDLLKCERCAVYLLDLDCCEANHLERIIERPGKTVQRHAPLNRVESGTVTVEDMRESGMRKPTSFTTIFELREGGTKTLVSRPSCFDLACSTLAQIAGYAASTGQILNIGDVKAWLTQKHSEGDAESARTILCMPIINGQRTLIGVAQLINKDTGSPFTDCDVSLFEAFAIFCGLGIHNTQMYENACKLMAKQKVALECLSYHATASNDATEMLVKENIPSAGNFNLYSFTFIDFELNDVETCKATIRMFLECNLVQQFHIPYDVLCRWVLSVKKNYRPVKYHNWRHALNVTQTMFAMFKTGKMDRFMSDLEMLGLLVACLCHDLDHRGTNNAFQTKTESPLAILYSTSTMEHHHFDQCVMILNTDSNNIFQALSPEDYRKVMKLVETAILSTDLAMYFKKRNKFLELIDNGEFDWQSDDKKELLSGMMMTACDVSAIAKPWEVQHRVAKLVADEFFDQGDLEKMQLKEQPIAMMDRERKDELPQMQVGFIDVICLPLYRVLSDTFPWVKPLYQGTLENRQNWQDLAEKVEMGLTWIDHDTIDKPVEAFTEITLKPKPTHTIIIEGNIGSGKTTFLETITKKLGHCEIFPEPVDVWQNYKGKNLLDLMYKNPKKYCYKFQKCVIKTMVEQHNKITDKRIKLMERSLFSARYCFIENNYQNNMLTKKEYQHLNEKIEENSKSIKCELIIYLRTSPNVVLDRIKARKRDGEEEISIEYLTKLHELHEKWLCETSVHRPAPVLIINGNLGKDEIIKEYIKFRRYTEETLKIL